MLISSNYLEEITVLAFGLLGIVFGIIFVLDGWRSFPTGGRGLLENSPKLQGLIAVLGAGVIPTLTDLTRAISGETKQLSPGFALAIYTLFVVSTTLIGLFILIVYAFIVAYSSIADIKISNNPIKIGILCLPYVAIAFQKGNDKFREELEKQSKLILFFEEQKRILELQRDNSVSFLTGVFTALVEQNIKHISGVDSFIKFVENYFSIFSQLFLDESNLLEDHRIALYYLDETTGKLLFLAGISPWNNRHTKRALNLGASFAGWALKNPQKVHIWRDSPLSNLPFESRQYSSNYKTIAACAVSPIKSQVQPKMVICIDTIKDTVNNLDEQNDYGKFTRTIILFLTVVVATAKESKGVTDEQLLQRCAN